MEMSSDDDDNSNEEGQLLPPLDEDLPLSQLGDSARGFLMLQKHWKRATEEATTGSEVGIAAALVNEYLLKKYLHCVIQGTPTTPLKTDPIKDAISTLDWAALARAVSDAHTASNPITNTPTKATDPARRSYGRP